MTISVSGPYLDDATCRQFQRAAEFAGRKWNAAILLGMALGFDRFSTLKQHVAGISDRLLTSRLHELIMAGLVARTVTPTTPVQVRYTLTAAGNELIHLLHPLVSWSQRWNAATAAQDSDTPTTSTAPTG
ncbi:winged helix-turn-helix transcriptional regulator [Microbacterium sp. P05]|uniref:winged helix-turn-helix transcriptional regulator n=1 Tax=Microbacterium sp. P05 TaxID=3366948 RepID=UPI00374733A4